MSDLTSEFEFQDDLTSTSPANDRLGFFGDGARFFGISIVNFLLTIVTFGLYYPWAKAKVRQYLWNETELQGSRFVFHGTGKEMFKGFVIAYAVFIGVYGLLTYATMAQSPTLLVIAMILFYSVLLLLVPIAIYGGWRYRITRTSWRGIYGTFNGSFKDWMKIVLPGILFTVLTFGIYIFWLQVKCQKYLFQHTQFGDLKLDFHGEGGQLFGINFLGGILMYPSLFLYVPIWIKQRFDFTVNNTSITDGENVRFLQSTLTNGEAFKILFTNFLLLVVTLGLAFPWTFIRWMKTMFENVVFPGDINLDNLVQQEGANKGNATGDEMMDIFDMDFGI